MLNQIKKVLEVMLIGQAPGITIGCCFERGRTACVLFPHQHERFEIHEPRA